MTDDRPTDRRRNEGSRRVPTQRESPVGSPVIRGDESVTGEHARHAVRFDPDDPTSLKRAAETVYRFATESDGGDHLTMLRGAAACAALVRGEGSYKAAAERGSAVAESDGETDDGSTAADSTDQSTDPSAVSVSFIRKWARVHDLPRSVRRQVAGGNIAPSAAKHIARVEGEDRLLLAWATLDGDLTVREVRAVASAVNDGVPIDVALTEHDVRLGQIELRLPKEPYRDLRRAASLAGVEPGQLVAGALENHLDDVERDLR